MLTRGVRGAITLDNNTEKAVKEGTVILLKEILDKNNIKNSDISHVIFTLTNDIDAAFPAKFAREKFCWDFVPMVCFNELSVKNSLKMCLRVLVVINTDKKQEEINHIYLRGATSLRPDLSL